MKRIFFDLDSSALLSEDGRARPFMDVVLRYCAYSKIEVVGLSADIRASLDASIVFGLNFTWVDKNKPWPLEPDLIISTSNELAKLPLVVVPPFNPDQSIEFAELSLAGRLLDSIKDRVVLNRYAPEKQITPKEEPKPNDEDTSNWAFEI